MKRPIRSALYSLLLTAALTQHAAAANLVLNGNFTGITNTVVGNTFTYGQFGNNSGQAPGSVLTVDNWDTSGYNFVYTPGIADRGTTANGANAGVAKEAPGQSTVTVNNVKYGNEYMWGTNNGGPSSFGTTNPFAGNFIAADGAYETAAVTQTIMGLQTGKAYALTFYWAAAQQESYTMATTEQWQVNLGSQQFSTAVYNLPGKSFSGWMQQTFVYTATAASEVLSFLAVGTPTGQPPFVLLAGVALNQVPEPSSWMMFAVVVGFLTVVGIVRRQRRRRLAVDAAV